MHIDFGDIEKTATFIRWRLKYLAECGDDLTDSELKLLVSFEDQFKKKGTLSERQLEVLEEIYKKH